MKPVHANELSMGYTPRKKKILTGFLDISPAHLAFFLTVCVKVVHKNAVYTTEAIIVKDSRSNGLSLK